MNLKISLKHLVYLWAFIAIPSTCQSFLLSPIVASQQNAAGASNLELQTTLTVNSDSDYPISLHWEYKQKRIWGLYIASSNSIENRRAPKCKCDRYSVRTSTSTSPAGQSVVTITLTITDLQPDDDNAEVGIVHATTRRLVRLNVGAEERKFVADIVFGLDESGSVNPEDFQHQLRWVNEVLGSFRNDIDSGDVRIGVVLFNSRARTAIQLNNYNYDALRERISGLSQISGGTDIEAAIRACKQALDGSTRQGVAKEMIILTDGESSGDILGAANDARMSGITTVAVGVGSGVNVNTLLQVAGDPARLFKATDFSNLNQVTAELRKVIRDSSVTELKNEQKVVADIMFGLDESGSVSVTDFQHQLNWVVGLLRSFRDLVDSGDVQVGIVLFDHNAFDEVQLKRYTYDTLTERISRLRQSRGGTNIAAAIRACKQALDGSTRQGVAKEMIILTDGDSAGNILGEADDARMSGIRTTAIGVGSRTKVSTLRDIAGSDARVFQVDDFESLEKVSAGVRSLVMGSGSGDEEQ